MSRITSFNTRTSFLLSGDQLLSTLRKTQLELQKAQEQISTGKKVNRPSEMPSQVSSALLLRESLRRRERFDRNLQAALSTLNVTDQALGDATDLLLESKGVALSQIGIGSDADTRKAEAGVIEGHIRAMLDIANRQFQGISLFGGNDGAEPGGLVFEDYLGGIRYTGSEDDLEADVGLLSTQPFVTNGATSFGALSARVKSVIDLDPQATSDTRINDLTGAQLVPVRRGTVLVNVGGTQASVDLTDADTLGDVAARLNDAIQSIDATSSVTIGAGGFELNAVGANITIDDIGAGQTAGDLGLRLTAAAGNSVSGVDVGVKLTRQSNLADLGVAVDLTSGLLITQGASTKVADFSGATTIEDMMNVINELNLGLRMEINAAGTGLDLVNEVSGIELSIGENGGSTATDLGLRSLDTSTQLADLNLGLGVTANPDEPDFAIELHDGRSFEVDLAGLNTVGEVMAAIEDAATAAGVNLGVDFAVGFAATGNGMTLTDNTVGATEFRVRQLNESLAATHLGIYQNAGAGATITGEDVAPVRVESVFTHMIALRDALLTNDERGITLAGGWIEGDMESVALARAEVGVSANRVEDAQQRSEDLDVLEQSLLSDIQDADAAEVITRFSQLQTQLQASLQVGSARQQLSLLDFLG
jgi:flagellar hook-associated protein 3 FlgL